MLSLPQNVVLLRAVISLPTPVTGFYGDSIHGAHPRSGHRAAERAGGRNTAVEGQFYACPLFVDNEGFDCRLLMEGRRLELGSSHEVPVKFLYRELALPKLAVGKDVLLHRYGRPASVAIRL
jgi:hypothetical protein